MLLRGDEGRGGAVLTENHRGEMGVGVGQC